YVFARNPATGTLKSRACYFVNDCRLLAAASAGPGTAAVASRRPPWIVDPGLVAASADGRTVYADGLVVLRRDPSDGSLSQPPGTRRRRPLRLRLRHVCTVAGRPLRLCRRRAGGGRL